MVIKVINKWMYGNESLRDEDAVLLDKLKEEWARIDAKSENKKGYLIDKLDKNSKEKLNKVIAVEAIDNSSKYSFANSFIKSLPLHFDKSGIWWAWNHNRKCWEIIDETDIFNLIRTHACFQNVIRQQERTEIINALKMYARENEPERAKVTWVQCNDEIVDLETGDRFEAKPEYFITNPIPWDLGTRDSTPTMDKIFAEWVGEDYVQTLYEIIAYCLIPDYPLSRIFCFMGAGMNGKSKFLELIGNFLGQNNICSTELDTLITSRFEITRLHKKLACLMGETNFNELSKTSMLKKLTGNDDIGFEYKNKNPFHDKNYAKILISTNNLPATSDKTIGFYRRWLIIDFPNQFSEKKDILGDIPEEEYENLATKCIGLLMDLLTRREFHKEGSIEERMEKYESKSNFLEKFMELYVNQDTTDGFITKADFYKTFIGWCKENRHREVAERTLGIKMKKLGIEEGKMYIDWHEKGGSVSKKQARAWLGIKWKK